jgi:Cdc6-like AAA superfamily ATPase
MTHKIDLRHLPTTSPVFVGRHDELALLDDAWAPTTTNGSGANVVTIVAMGGTGKTALVKHWLAALAGRHYP